MSPTRRPLTPRGPHVRRLAAALLLSLLLAACRSGAAANPLLTATPPPRQAAGQPGQPGVKVGLVWETDDTATVLDRPAALAVDRRGQTYVVDAGHARLAVFDHDGRFRRAWGGPGSDAGQFRFLSTAHCLSDDHPEACPPEAGGGVAVDGQDRVYVADLGNSRVQVFDSAGRFLTSWGQEGSGPGEFLLPRGIAVDGGGRVYVSDSENHRVQVFDRHGRFLTMWGSLGEAEGRFARPGALALDGRGRLAVADLWNDRVQLFDRDGRFLAAWRVTGHGMFGDGSHRPASGLGFDGQGGLVVAGAETPVQHLDGTGQALRAWRADWRGQGRLVRPAGVAVDVDGDIYVADAGGDQVVKFRVLTPVTR